MATVAELKAILDAPCPNADDQAVHDRLARYDLLRATHTQDCASRQAYQNKPCTCDTTIEEEDTPMKHQYHDTAKNLEITAEELAEVGEVLADMAGTCARAAIIKSKITRFGIGDCHPERPGVTNQQRLELELGHLAAMVKILVRTGLITQEGIDAGEANKMEKLRSWYRDNPHKEQPPC